MWIVVEKEELTLSAGGGVVVRMSIVVRKIEKNRIETT